MTVHLSITLRYRTLACHPTQSPESSQDAARHKSIDQQIISPTGIFILSTTSIKHCLKSNEIQARILVPVHVFFLHVHVREHEHEHEHKV